MWGMMKEMNEMNEMMKESGGKAGTVVHVECVNACQGLGVLYYAQTISGDILKNPSSSSRIFSSFHISFVEHHNSKYSPLLYFLVLYLASSILIICLPGIPFCRHTFFFTYFTICVFSPSPHFTYPS